MNPTQVNYKHLYYFWVVAKEGSITKASTQLDLAIQTVSTQLSKLEQSLGYALFSLSGRRLELTEAGKLVLKYADDIFLLGKEMQTALQNNPNKRQTLNVGIADVLPKLMVYGLLEPVQQLKNPVRLVCYEGKFEYLLSELVMHKLDVILTDRAVATNANMLLYNHVLGDSGLTIFGSPQKIIPYKNNFPQSLDGAPFILPTQNSAIRSRLDQWFKTQRIYPDVVAEVEDSALLMTFGRSGLGLFIAPTVISDVICEQYGVVSLGNINDVREEFFAITPERRIKHPAVAAIWENARQQLIDPS